MKLVSKSEKETIAIGEKLGRLLKKGSLIALNGDLACGKTVLTKGIGKALNVKEVINSPTFTILKIYEGDLTLYHIDAYRLYENPYDLGFEEYRDSGIMVIEWFDYVKDNFDDEYLEINMRYIDDTTREMEFISHGKEYDAIVKEMM